MRINRPRNDANGRRRPARYLGMRVPNRGDASSNPGRCRPCGVRCRRPACLFPSRSRSPGRRRAAPVTIYTKKRKSEMRSRLAGNDYAVQYNPDQNDGMNVELYNGRQRERRKSRPPAPPSSRPHPVHHWSGCTLLELHCHWCVAWSLSSCVCSTLARRPRLTCGSFGLCRSWLPMRARPRANASARRRKMSTLHVSTSAVVAVNASLKPNSARAMGPRSTATAAALWIRRRPPAPLSATPRRRLRCG